MWMVSFNFCRYKYPCNFLNVWTIFALPWTSCVATVFCFPYQFFFLSKCLLNRHFSRHNFLFCGMEFKDKGFIRELIWLPPDQLWPSNEEKAWSSSTRRSARLGPKSGWVHLCDSSQELPKSDLISLCHPPQINIEIIRKLDQVN